MSEDAKKLKAMTFFSDIKREGVVDMINESDAFELLQMVVIDGEIFLNEYRVELKARLEELRQPLINPDDDEDVCGSCGWRLPV